MEKIYTDKKSGEKLIKKTCDNGDVFYFNGKNQYHRTDGPAMEYSDGQIEWFKNGRTHNLNGPAVVYANGDKEYWVEEVEYTELEFNIYARNLKLENL